MKCLTRLVLIMLSVMLCVYSSVLQDPSKVVFAQQNSGDYSDGTFYILASIDVDSSDYLYVDSYMEVEFDDYEDIDSIELDVSATEDGSVFGGDTAYGDDSSDAVVSLKSNSPVATGHEYGVESDGYACYDDGEGDEDCEYVGTAYAQVSLQSPPPMISSLNPSSVQQGDQGTLTINGTNLVENATDQLILNYSGQGMPFTPTGTPSSTQATFSYDFSGYDTGTYQIYVTNNEGESEPVNFTVNPPQNACTQSRTPNSFSLQISDLTSQAGSFTVFHPTDAKTDAATTVNFGPSSTPQSIAAAIAAAITRNNLQYGITAQADGTTVNVQSRQAFGAVSANSSGSTFSVGNPSTLSCVISKLKQYMPCAGLYPSYDTKLTYRKEKITETAKEHIIRRHINNSPTPGTTVYANTLKLSTDALFSKVQQYNRTTFVLSWGINGVYELTWPQPKGGGKIWGLIGIDSANHDLHTNHLVLSSDRCTVITSYPVAP